MKRLLATALIFAFAAFAQDAIRFADVLRAAPADAKLVLISDEGLIVGYSEDLSRAGLRVVLAYDFRGDAVVLVTAADGSVTHEFPARVNDGGVVTVDGRALGESLAAAGFGPPTFATAGPPSDVPSGAADAPGQAGDAPGPPPQADGAPGAGSDAAAGGGQGGAGAGGDEGDDDEDEDEDEDEDGSDGGEGRPESTGRP